MARTFFFLLILVNLLFFAWSQGYFGAVADGREPQRLGNQLAPEKLRVVGIGTSSPAPAQTEQNCRSVSGLALGEAQRLVAQARQPELRLSVKLNETPKNIYRVLISPLANRAAADKKMAELKKRDIADFSLITEEGPDQFAILLGVFNTELAANEYLRELAKRNVRTAKVQVRENPFDKARLEVRGPADLLAKQLAELLTGQGAAKIGDCPNGR
ncbi:MAG: SPOR domain-containing protein [Proteobacteria bacterium]|nr:SPOR domain-containing protein [Pseudomonadota bacterium]